MPQRNKSLELNSKSKKKEPFSPKIDIVFQALFGEVGSERITKSFLECILEEKIDEIDLSKNPILRRQTPNSKLGILDIIAKINGKEYCNIEMQMVSQIAMIERMLYYWSRLYSKQLKQSEDYQVLERTIEILIADFELKELKGLGYHTKWQIIEENHRKVILTDKFEFHIIELPKIKKVNEENELLDWLHFINNPQSERVIKKMEENKELKEAGQKLEGLTEDEMLESILEAELRNRRDKKAIYAAGVEDGIEKKQKEIILEMLKKEFSIETISEITKLSTEEIQKIIQSD